MFLYRGVTLRAVLKTNFTKRLTDFTALKRFRQ